MSAVTHPPGPLVRTLPVTTPAAPSPWAGAVSPPRARHLRGTSGREAARSALAVAAAGAGAIHLSSAGAHLAEWAPLGYSFAAAAALQVVWGAALVRRESRALLLAGALGMAAVLGVWLLSRTAGLPVGPDAGVASPVGIADGLCVALEVPVLLGALVLLRRPAALRRPAGRTARRLVAATTLGVLATTGVAVAQPPHAHPEPAATAKAGGPGDIAGTPMVETGTDANGNGVDDGVEAYFAAQFLAAHEGHEGYPQPSRP